MKNYQIIIVGSGPAGISTALHLNLLKPSITEKILILEKTKHPREKICAGGIVGNAQNELNNMNISFSDMNISKVTTDILRFHLGDEWNDTYESGFTSVVRRNEFDAQLVNIARERGISINENEKVIDIERTDDGIKVITEKDTYLAQILIGADGVGSIVRQKFCGKASEYEFSRLHLIETPVKEEETAEFQNGAIGFDMSYVPLGLQGYVWDFPCYIDGKPFLSRGIVDHNPNISERVDIIAIFREALKKRGVNLDDYELKTYPEMSFNPTNKISAERVLLVGDSAGIDPLLGEGISQSLGYGRVAANSILKALETDDFSFANYNQEVLQEPFGKELMAYKMLADNIYRGESVFWVSLLWKDKDMQKLLTQSYSGHLYIHTIPQEVLGEKIEAHQKNGDFTLPEGVSLKK